MSAPPSFDPAAVVALLQDLDHLQTDLHRALPRGGGPRMRIADVLDRLEQIRARWRTGIRPASTGRPTP